MAGRRAGKPLLDLLVALKASAHVFTAKFTHADDARVGVAVVAVPEATSAALLGHVPEGIADELDGGGGVSGEDEVLSLNSLVFFLINSV